MTEDTGWALLMNAGSTQMLGVRRGLRRGGRRGGSSAARRWIRRVARPRPPGSGRAGGAAGRPWCSDSPSSPDRPVRRCNWRFHVFSRLIFRAVCPFVLSQGDTQFAALWRETLWNFQLQSGWFLTLFITISSEWIYWHASPRCCLG